MDAAEKSGIRFQLVLQHHGQFSTHSDANWDSNPWNKKNGGWLSTPDEFFTNPRALAQTKAKYRYIIARWGYSTAVMAWELFNEVENTDSYTHKHQDEIAAWHRAMANFIRQQDPYKHLITTSSDLQLAMWQDMDFYQPHRYTSDPLSAAVLPDPRKLEKPIFFGEFGPSKGMIKDQGEWLRKALWAGAVSGAGGAPQYWAWTSIDRRLSSPVSRDSGQSTACCPQRLAWKPKSDLS
jgi:endo-1,4-beta-mannosidase